MSFLQRFLERVLRNNPSRMARTSFDDLTKISLMPTYASDATATSR